jgi:hypothetical protein
MSLASIDLQGVTLEDIAKSLNRLTEMSQTMNALVNDLRPILPQLSSFFSKNSNANPNTNPNAYGDEISPGGSFKRRRVGLDQGDGFITRRMPNQFIDLRLEPLTLPMPTVDPTSTGEEISKGPPRAIAFVSVHDNLKLTDPSFANTFFSGSAEPIPDGIIITSMYYFTNNYGLCAEDDAFGEMNQLQRYKKGRPPLLRQCVDTNSKPLSSVTDGYEMFIRHHRTHINTLYTLWYIIVNGKKEETMYSRVKKNRDHGKYGDGKVHPISRKYLSEFVDVLYMHNLEVQKFYSTLIRVCAKLQHFISNLSISQNYLSLLSDSTVQFLIFAFTSEHYFSQCFSSLLVYDEKSKKNLIDQEQCDTLNEFVNTIEKSMDVILQSEPEVYSKLDLVPSGINIQSDSRSRQSVLSTINVELLNKLSFDNDNSSNYQICVDKIQELYIFYIFTILVKANEKNLHIGKRMIIEVTELIISDMKHIVPPESSLSQQYYTHDIHRIPLKTMNHVSAVAHLEPRTRDVICMTFQQRQLRRRDILSKLKDKIGSWMSKTAKSSPIQKFKLLIVTMLEQDWILSWTIADFMSHLYRAYSALDVPEIIFKSFSTEEKPVDTSTSIEFQEDEILNSSKDTDIVDSLFDVFEAHERPDASAMIKIKSEVKSEYDDLL